MCGFAHRYTNKLLQYSSNSDTIAGIIKLGDGLMQIGTFLADIDALLPLIISGFMTWKNVGKLNNQNMPRYAQLQLVA